MTTLYRSNLVHTPMLTALGTTTSLFGKLRMAWHRKQERERTAEIYDDLIARADDHILDDLGYSRDELVRMRAQLYQ